MGAGLWILGTLGSFLSFWPLLLVVYLGTLTLPKVIVHHQDHFRPLLSKVLEVIQQKWKTLKHKTVGITTGMILLLALTSGLTKLYMIFFACVAIKVYEKNNKQVFETAMVQVRRKARRMSFQVRYLFFKCLHKPRSHLFGRREEKGGGGGGGGGGKGERKMEKSSISVWYLKMNVYLHYL